VSALFVTATGTDVGKTFVAAGLIRHLRRAGRDVDAFKPVVSGFDPQGAAESDPGVLLSALGRPITSAEIDRVSPWRFRAPLSPDMAARLEGRAIDFTALVKHSREAIANTRGFLFIEGVGGIMAPLDDRHTVLDWMAALGVPVILVAGSYLGTISHTLAALDVLRRRELTVAALVVSETENSTVPLDETVATLARFVGQTNIVAIPRLPPGEYGHPAFGQIIPI
jgi:dethiobiotin synthetase